MTGEIQCTLCANTKGAWGGAKCSECSLYKKAHYVLGKGPVRNVDYFCVTVNPSMSFVSRNTAQHDSWALDNEKVIVSAFGDYKRANLYTYEGRYTYAVRCTSKKVVKKQYDCCSPLFFDELTSMRTPDKPLFIFALGGVVVKALGIKFKKIKMLQDKWVETTINGVPAYVFVSLSIPQLASKSGYTSILRRHIELFMDGVHRVHQGNKLSTEINVEELTENHTYPSTIEEIDAITRLIIDYHVPGTTTPENHAIAIDTETDTLHPQYGVKLLTFIVSWAKGYSVSIPVEHKESPVTFEEVAPFLVKILQCDKPKIFANGQYDVKVLWQKGLNCLNNYKWDITLGEHLLNEDKKGNYNLDSMTSLYLPAYAKYKDLLDKENNLVAKDNGYADIPLKILHVYGALDGDVTRQICMLQRAAVRREQLELTKKRKLLSRNKYFVSVAKPRCLHPEPITHLMLNHCIKTTTLLARMELDGAPINRPYLKDVMQAVALDLLRTQTNIKALVKQHNFNPKSPVQLRNVLFSAGYLHPVTGKKVIHRELLREDSEKELERTPTGQIAVGVDLLKYLSNSLQCPLSTEILKLRTWTKTLDTYVRPLYDLSEKDGKIHTSYLMFGTGTGRLSSQNVNLQNIPMFLGPYNIKKAFIPRDPINNCIINADAKAAEVRIYAAYSRDKNLIQALCDGMDPHSYFASEVYNPATVLAGVRDKTARSKLLQAVGIDEEHAWSYEDFENKDIDPVYRKRLDKLRKNTKRVVFGILYGAGKFKIASSIGVDVDNAQMIIDLLFKSFPTIPEYVRITKEQIKHIGTLETFMGRRRRFDLRGQPKYKHARAERQGVNFNIQATSSDIVMDVLEAVVGPVSEIGGNILLTVHDSGVFDPEKKYAHQMKDIIHEYGVRQVAKKYPWIPVPFSWDCEAGPNYGETVLI
jgi:DNA polymerase I-like protein with 3'-5' exonuclease and polymerase domains